MGIFTDGSDFDVEISQRWWGLMSYALKRKGLNISLQKDLDDLGYEDLLVEIRVNGKADVIYFRREGAEDVSFYFTVSRFVESYSSNELKE